MATQQIMSKQYFNGNPQKYIDAMIKEEILPPEALQHRQQYYCTFDTESLECKKTLRILLILLKVV